MITNSPERLYFYLEELMHNLASSKDYTIVKNGEPVKLCFAGDSPLITIEESPHHNTVKDVYKFLGYLNYEKVKMDSIRVDIDFKTKQLLLSAMESED